MIRNKKNLKGKSYLKEGPTTKIEIDRENAKNRPKRKVQKKTLFEELDQLINEPKQQKRKGRTKKD